METNQTKKLIIGPFIRTSDSSAKIMWTVIICLVPAGIWGIGVFGWHSLAVILCCLAVSIFSEWLLTVLLKKNSISDGSAVLTGLLIAYNMPPHVPLFVPIIACIFAIGVAKWAFGGLGCNWANPALAGRVFVFFSFVRPMTLWTIPRPLINETFLSHASQMGFHTYPGIDTVTGPSPLGIVKTVLADGTKNFSGPMDILRQFSFPQSSVDQQITGWLNQHLFTPLHSALPGGFIDIVIGNKAGCIGEVSILLLLIGAIILLIRRIITWEIPILYCSVFGFLVWIFGGLPYTKTYFSGDVFFALCTGGLFLGAFFMATDMVTSPLTRTGKILFGVFCGITTFLFRYFGANPEGVSLSILLMNMFVPMINKFTQPKRYGLNKGKIYAGK